MRLSLALAVVAVTLLTMPEATLAADSGTPLAAGRERVRIYQLFVRLFGNTNTTCKPNGTLAENGSGKFADINDAALASIREMGFTHIWLTGVIQQATSTDYSVVGKSADDPDLLKGLAGSPYAVKDYFDVSPDYAQDPAKRLEEFEALLKRVHRHGMRVLIDFVPNHVARSYHSTDHPESNFGQEDDKTEFFRRDNNFFYLRPDPEQGQTPPLKLPTYDFATGEALSATCKVLGGICDGFYAGEIDFGRVTGNNEVSWSPSKDSWYETIKLNYGFDFSDPAKSRREYPRPEAPDVPIPNTWHKVDQVMAYWQRLGVDGFRCDMAHMIPPEFWQWAIARARERQRDVFFVAEAYDDDPAKVPPSGDPANTRKHEMQILLEAGFDAVYDDPSYKTIMRVYNGPAWANDLDAASRNERIFECGLRYAENHDEVRIAAEGQWGGVGMHAGRPACGVLFALSRGPVMIYNGQEVGEPARGVAGFGGGNSRTTIFDYWMMPELAKWVNGHAYDGAHLSPEQKALREFYGRLLCTAGEPAFRDGRFYPLNPGNTYSANYGRVDGDPASGHWLYACLRYDPVTGQRFLVVVNLHRAVTFEHVNIYLAKEALEFLGLGREQSGGGVPVLGFREHLFPDLGSRVEQHTESADSTRLDLLSIPPLTPLYFEVTATGRGR